MFHQVGYLIAGAILIAALGRACNQNRMAVLIACSIWGGIVSTLR